MALIQKGEFAQGIAELQEAYATKPHRNVLFNIARAYQDWGRSEEALDYYRRYLAARPPDAAEVQITVAQLERQLEKNAAQNAEPPASWRSAARSSISRSREYGCLSPLSPRPRRSYVKTVKCCERRAASFADGPNARLHSAPSTTMTGCPLPARSNAIGVPSFEITVFITSPFPAP